MSQTTTRPSLLDDEPSLRKAPTRTASASSVNRAERVKIGLAIAFILVAGVMMYLQFANRPADIGDLTRYVPVINAKTGEVIEKYDLKATSEPWPWAAAGGERVLYPAELCFWNKDGSVRTKPTFVLLNTFRGEKGDTICPDCGRKVVPRNPPPPGDLMAKALEEDAKR